MIQVVPTPRNMMHYGTVMGFGLVQKTALMSAFMARKPVTLIDALGRVQIGIINTLQHEDGSGKCFNITLENNSNFFIRTL